MDISKQSGIVYEHSKISDKHYFGGYLNLAENNIEEVFKAFYKRFLNKGNKDGIQIINNYFTNALAISDYQKGVHYLQQYFPVIRYLYLPITSTHFEKSKDKEKARRDYFKANFICLIKAIRCLRNFYTHYYHETLYFDTPFYELLDSLFLSVIKDVRKHRMKNDMTRLTLKKTLQEELEILKADKISKLEQDKLEGKRVSLTDGDIENAVLNDAFYHLLFKTKSGEEQVNRYYKSVLDKKVENKIEISQSGLLFLLGLFLTKKQGEDLRGRVRGFKAKTISDTESIDRNHNSLKFMATHWVFGYLAYKGLKHRLTTSFSKETLLVQIVDELSKVPDEVYTTFTEERREQFIEDINEYIQESEISKPINEATVIHPVIRKRYENKFIYFVLRYLDEFADFPSLRFQVHLGNYVQDRREKEIEGTSFTTERLVKQKIHVFGKLSKVTSLKTNYFSKQGEEDIHWERYPNPSYNLVAENIPIFIDLQKSKVQGAPRLFGEITKLKVKRQKEIDNELGREKEDTDKKKERVSLIDNELKDKKFKDVYVGAPTAFLSSNELPALLHELLVNKKSGKEIEEILTSKLVERFNIIKKYETKQQLSTSQIPRNLRKGTRDKIVDVDKLVRAFNTEIGITKQKLQLIRNNNHELKQDKRKYVFTNKELGQEATWLADDLKRFMPETVKSNWRGYHHSQLQQSLAYFDQRPNEAKSLLTAFWNWDEDKYLWNNGIKKAFQARGFDRLYKSYLESREKVYTNLMKQLVSFKSNQRLLKKFLKQQNVWTIFYKRLYIIDTLEKQKEKLLSQPLVFPRGIFDEKPTYIKGEDVDKNPELFADWYTYFLDQKEYQNFYDYDRDYTELFQEVPPVEVNKYELSSEQKLELFKRKQDKKIKKIQMQDVYLSLVAKSIYTNLFHQEVSFNLKELYLTQDERRDIAKEASAQSEREKGDHSENIINSSFIWTKTTSYQSDQIQEPAVKIKEIGKFKRFLEEAKVKAILSYDKTKIWSKLELEEELNTYEAIRRESILKEIQNLEKSILEKSKFYGQNHPPEFELGGNPNFRMYIARGILRKFGLANDEDISWIKGLKEGSIENRKKLRELREKEELVQKLYLLILVRNKIAHNQLPKKEYFEYIKSFVDTTAVTSFSEVLWLFVEQTVAELNSRMK